MPDNKKFKVGDMVLIDFYIDRIIEDSEGKKFDLIRKCEECSYNFYGLTEKQIENPKEYLK